MNSKIDTLIKDAQASIDGLEQLLVYFFANVSSEDWHTFQSHSDKIKKCTEMWRDDPLSQRYLLAIDGTNAYFKSDGELAEHNLAKVLPPNYYWKNTDIQGALESIYAGNHRSKGQFDKAIFHLSRAIRLINPKGSLSNLLVMSYYQLGEVYRLLGEDEEAEKCYKEGIDSNEYQNANLFRLYSGLGNLYIQTGNLDNARTSFEQSLKASESHAQEARAYFDLSQYYQKVKNFETALEHAERSYKIRQEENLLDAAISCRILIGKIFLKQNRNKESIETLNLAMSSLSGYAAGTKRKDIFGLLSRAYEKIGNYELAYDSFLKFEKIQSDIFSKQQKEIFKLKNKEINEQKEKVELAHKDIQDSILYAKRIQTAILPTNKLVKDYLAQSFILYKPKDVVAGDFYWIESCVSDKASVSEGKQDVIYFAAADCTGHGVPGAMVSVICNNGLNRAVREFGLRKPSEILDKTRELVIQEFEKSEEEVKDGMDISLCALNTKTNKLEWAGANNPLWIVTNRQLSDISFQTDGQQLTAHNLSLYEIKANKQPIGKYGRETPFTNHNIQLQKGDTIYIFTDGYPDQFGGEKGKKYKSGNFKKTLVRLSKESIEKQKDVLDQEFENWRGTLEQIDDVCVIGVRV